MKSKNWNPADRLSEWDKLRIDKYQKFWPESVLVLVIPSKHWYYAQIASQIKLPVNSKDNLDVTKEFRQFEEVFNAVKIDTMYAYKRTIAEVFGIFGHKRDSAAYFSEDKYEGWDQNEHLLDFNKNNRCLKGEELYGAYVREILYLKQSLMKT